ncbi:MAG: cupin domain-containing protein [Pirellulaceae bacterium]
MIEIRNHSTSILEHSKGKLFESGPMRLMRLVLQKGERIAEHRAPGDITVHCIAGEIEFEVDDEKARLSEDQLIHVADRKTHALAAIEDALVLVTMILPQSES